MATPAAQVIEDLRLQVENTVGVMDSAIVFIKGEVVRQEAAVAASVGLGATAEQLVPMTDHIAALKAKSTELAQAIVA